MKSKFGHLIEEVADDKYTMVVDGFDFEFSKETLKLFLYFEEAIYNK